jgi:hypothetical protein
MFSKDLLECPLVVKWQNCLEKIFMGQLSITVTEQWIKTYWYVVKGISVYDINHVQGEGTHR